MNSKVKIVSAASLSLLAFALCGCASSLSGGRLLGGPGPVEVTVTTSPTVRAECVLTNKEGSQTIHSPETALVTRSKSDLHVVCTQSGFEASQVTVPAEFEPLVLSNALCGASAPICLALDWGQGAFHKYPKFVQVPLVPLPGAPPDADALQAEDSQASP